GEERNQADERTNLQVVMIAAREMQNIVVEAVLVVPELDTFAAPVVHGVGDVNEVFEEFAGHAFVGGIFASELQGDHQHVQAIHSHPTRTVGLLQVASGRQRGGAVEHADVVQAQESTLEDVQAFGILAINPPGEIQQKLVKDAFEEVAVRFATNSFFDF